MNRILVVGVSGLVGEHLMNSLLASGKSPVGTYYSRSIPTAEYLDICDALSVNNLLERLQPEIIFLPAALTNVDFCEKNQDLSYKINVIGMKNMVDGANKVAARLIYISTDYIFDGTAGPYNEDAPANPISEYGHQKLEAEHYIALTSLNYLIIRTTVVYGWERQGKNFIYRLINSLRDELSVKVPDDQIGTPTYAPELAKAAAQLALTDSKVVINIAGADWISRYDFALEAAKVFNLRNDLIIPVATSNLNQPARRPLLAGLRTEKAAKLLKVDFLSSNQGLSLMAEQKPDLVEPSS